MRHENVVGGLYRKARVNFSKEAQVCSFPPLDNFKRLLVMVMNDSENDRNIEHKMAVSECNLLLAFKVL